MEILQKVGSLPTWSQADVCGLLDQVARGLSDADIDWDADAGEEWARVIVDSEVDCLIRAPTSVGRAHRFAFLRAPSTSTAPLRPLLLAYEADVVELADFEEPSLSIDEDALAAFIGPGRLLPPAHVLDRRRFSANDLCFVTA